jgi:photosystem II stability/assembly factor-like uncharacterized protein
MRPRVAALHRAHARVAVAFALLVGAGRAFGQSGVWSTRGPAGGNIYCVVADPSQPSTLYAGTAQGVFKSDDGGANWGIASAGIPAARVQTLAIDPTSTSTLYAGTLTPRGAPSIGVFKSTDGAASWVPINDGLIDPLTGISPLDVEALTLDPRDSNTLLAGTVSSDIFKSTDGGTSWTAQTYGGYSVGLQVSAFQFDPVAPSRVYAASTLGLLRSSDGGSNWSGYGNAGVPFFALAIDPTNPTSLYAGDSTGSGIWKSTDGGAHWNKANGSLPTNQGSLPSVIALAVDPAHPSTVYAGTYGSGLFLSANGAASWAAAGSAMRDPVAALAFAPGQGSTLYAGTLGGGVYQSRDGANSWTPINAGLVSTVVYALLLDPAAPGTVYASTYDGVEKSSDGGATWQDRDTGLPIAPVAALALAPGSLQTLFAGTLGGGLLKSSDGGATWNASSQGLTDSYISSIVIDPTAPSTLYAGTAHPYDGSHAERVFKSTDGGTTWTQTGLDAAQFSIDFIAVNPAKPVQIIAGSQGAIGYFQSLDAGKSWSAVGTGASCGGINAILFEPSGSTLYIGGTAGVCRSTDGGKTWLSSSVGGFLSVTALVLDPLASSTLYAGTELDTTTGASGVFRSIDGGQTWDALGSGLSPITVTALAIDNEGIALYAGTHGGGVTELVFTANRLPVRLSARPGRRTRVVIPP